MEARFKSAQAAVAAAQAQAQEAETMAGYTVVRATDAGVVAERRVAVGDLAQPGQPLLTLYNPDLLQIEGEVNDSYRPQVRTGEAAKVSVPAVSWQAEVPIAEVFAVSDSASRTFKVRTAVVLERRLVPGMFARLSLPLPATMGLLIPKSAVQQVGQLSMVKVWQDQTARLRQVKLGRELDARVEVLAGLQPGEKVLLP